MKYQFSWPTNFIKLPTAINGSGSSYIGSRYIGRGGVAQTLSKPKFNIGDKVYNTIDPTIKGIITLVDSDRLSYELSNFFWFTEEYLALCPEQDKIALEDKKCTCGAHKTYGMEFKGHSTWCDLYEK